MEPSPKKILVCVNERITGSKPFCGGRGGREIARLIEEGVKARGLAIPMERFICFGACPDGPDVRLSPGGPFLHHVKLDDVPTILDEAEQFVLTGQ